MHQSINGNTKIASWGVAVVLLLGFDGDNKLQRPICTTATNVTSRANNRIITTPTIRPSPLNENRMEVPPQLVKDPPDILLFDDVAVLPTLV
jgi:hypothetical protein